MRWLALGLVSAALSAALLALHVPAAVLLGCMLGALVFSTRGVQLAVPHIAFGWGQGLLGCLMAQSLHPAQLGPVLRQWPLFLAGTVLLIAASAFFFASLEAMIWRMASLSPLANSAAAAKATFSSSTVFDPLIC